MDAEAHRAEVEAWREGRYERLRADIGWLTLAGLGWLRPGVNRIGADPDADVVLPSGPAEAGTLTVTEGSAVASGRFLHDGEPAEGLRLVSDADGEPTMLELGALRMCLIERGGRLAVRTWDLEAAALRAFDGIDHWPVDVAWRLDGRFEPAPDRTIAVPDVLGSVEEEPSPGDVVFRAAGEEHRLQALIGSGDTGELWLVFGDATNGSETYAGGRFLYTPPPEPDGRVIVDFNRAYNPPCVFSPYATCPLPWPANRLPVRIEAGERAYGDAH
ncbi:MAG TPA: DUF1684 domain-containing protein [Candidatus Limnocylindria bacterium]|nr:DUF1684 domain-containing protein [Candidatus Limnocylindria bacterium]